MSSVCAWCHVCHPQTVVSGSALFVMSSDVHLRFRSLFFIVKYTEHCSYLLKATARLLKSECSGSFFPNQFPCCDFCRL
uniref:Uncharacterized protein n=1 Tax=Kalanchoe fedtschenkoi TaxID=63787 RepID=A0A7N1A9S7_KALFE